MTCNGCGPKDIIQKGRIGSRVSFSGINNAGACTVSHRIVGAPTVLGLFIFLPGVSKSSDVSGGTLLKKTKSRFVEHTVHTVHTGHTVQYREQTRTPAQKNQQQQQHLAQRKAIVFNSRQINNINANRL